MLLRLHKQPPHHSTYDNKGYGAHFEVLHSYERKHQYSPRKYVGEIFTERLFVDEHHGSRSNKSNYNILHHIQYRLYVDVVSVSAEYLD